MAAEWQRQVDAPDGSSFVVRVYRSGTMRRFPSAHDAPVPSGALLGPLLLIGWLLHWTVFGRTWTVAVTPWHNLPGPRRRARFTSRELAESRAESVSSAIRLGTWVPDDGPLATDL